ncbi:MAG: TetR/AcrR family transcriptional regulator [Vicinamibacterales bacterium]
MEKAVGRKRRDGERSRAAIVSGATMLASVDGLEGLTLGRLATHLGVSKSGLYAHFGSKEALQLAVVDHAAAIVQAEIIQPASAADPGIARLAALAEAYLSYLERGVFPGGCFFRALAAEMGGRDGELPARAAAWMAGWTARLEAELEHARAAGEIGQGTDLAQAAFEIDAVLGAANTAWSLTRDTSALARARAGLEHVLGWVAG